MFDYNTTRKNLNGPSIFIFYSSRKQQYIEIFDQKSSAIPEVGRQKLKLSRVTLKVDVGCKASEFDNGKE